ncbi:MAG TPA: hypothetical protein VF677_06400 [Flavobacterium sp.]|jgi:hypothetical protein
MKNIILITCLLISIVFSGCSNKKNKKIDMSIYTIEIPYNWNEIKINGIDSDVRAILTSSGDTIISDYGRYSEKFEETNKVFSKKQILKYKALGMETKNLFWSNIPEIDQAQGTFLNEYYMYETIDNYNVKFRISKRNNKGVTGISIDSVFKTNNRLTISSKNLNKTEKDLLVSSFYSIKFKKQ